MRARLLAVGAALFLVFAACADDDTNGTADTTTTTTTQRGEAAGQEALDRIARAAENTVEEGTARFSVEVTSDVADAQGSEDSLVSAQGEEDYDADIRRITFTGPAGDLEVIVEGTDAYVEVPATEDETWARIDLDRLVQGDIGFGGPGGIPFQDREANLDALRTAARDARDLGEEEVRGEQTDHFEVTLDLRGAADEAEPEVRRALEETIERTGAEELDMEVWIDADDRIRRIAYNLDVGQVELSEDADAGEAEADPEGNIRVIVEYFDFGADITIETPDEESVIDFDEDQIRDTFGGGPTGGTTTTSDGGETTTSSTTSSSTTTTTQG